MLAALLCLSGCSAAFAKPLFDEDNCAAVDEVRFQVWDIERQEDLTFTCDDSGQVAEILEYLRSLRFTRSFERIEGGNFFCLAHEREELWFVASGNYVCIGERTYLCADDTDIPCTILEIMGLSDTYCISCAPPPVD